MVNHQLTYAMYLVFYTAYSTCWLFLKLVNIVLARVINLHMFFHTVAPFVGALLVIYVFINQCPWAPRFNCRLLFTMLLLIVTLPQAILYVTYHRHVSELLSIAQTCIALFLFLYRNRFSPCCIFYTPTLLIIVHDMYEVPLTTVQWLLKSFPNVNVALLSMLYMGVLFTSPLLFETVRSRRMLLIVTILLLFSNIWAMLEMLDLTRGVPLMFSIPASLISRASTILLSYMLAIPGNTFLKSSSSR